jgi:pyruvate formate lyase activating enzyme
MIDIAKLAEKEGVKCTMVSNGFINPEPLKKLIKYIDAFNIDIKSISEKFYTKICGARLKPILETLKVIFKSGKHLEITNLLIPGLNDSEKEIGKLVIWIRDNLSSEVPLHFSAFYPCHKLTSIKPTPPSTVIRAAEIAKKLGMKNVHTGNI